MTTIFIDSFSGAVASLSARKQREVIPVLRALQHDPNVSTWDMAEHGLWITIKSLEERGWVTEEKRAFPWLCFRITEAGKQALKEAE